LHLGNNDIAAAVTANGHVAVNGVQINVAPAIVVNGDGLTGLFNVDFST
jgi:hypothetical protein